MIQLLFNKKLIAVAGVILLIVIVVIVTLFILNNRQGHPLTKVLITTEGTEFLAWWDVGYSDTVSNRTEYELPITLNLANQQGWVKASSCIDGQGFYYTKSEEQAIILIFDIDGNLIGIYQHSSNVMPEPWSKTTGPLKTDGSPILNYEHFGVYLFLLDPTNACNKGTAYETLLASPANLPSYSIPITSDVAVSLNWYDPVLCAPGRGRYFTRPEFSHILMYNTSGNAIGIYQHTADEMPSPWFKTKEIIGGGSIPVVEVEHYGFFIYFQDPMTACQRSDADYDSVGIGGSDYQGGHAVREYEPAPTPTPKLDATETITKISTSLSSGSRTFAVTNPEDQTNIATGIASSKIGELISNLTNAQEGTSKWIDNISHRGLTGNVESSNTTKILFSAKSDNLKVSLWINDDNHVNLIEITGTITHEEKEFSKLHISPE